MLNFKTLYDTEIFLSPAMVTEVMEVPAGVAVDCKPAKGPVFIVFSANGVRYPVDRSVRDVIVAAVREFHEKRTPEQDPADWWKKGEKDE